MSYPLVLRDQVQTELDEAHAYYEAQRVGLGDDFVARVNDAMKRIAETPTMHAPCYGQVRRSVVSKFKSYCVYYIFLDDQVQVVSVFHSSRDPAVWQGQV